MLRVYWFPSDLPGCKPGVGRFPLILTVLSRDYHRGYYTAY